MARLSLTQIDLTSYDKWCELLDDLNIAPKDGDLGPEIVILDVTLDKVEY